MFSWVTSHIVTVWFTSGVSLPAGAGPGLRGRRVAARRVVGEVPACASAQRNQTKQPRMIPRHANRPAPVNITAMLIMWAMNPNMSIVRSLGWPVTGVSRSLSCVLLQPRRCRSSSAHIVPMGGPVFFGGNKRAYVAWLVVGGSFDRGRVNRGVLGKRGAARVSIAGRAIQLHGVTKMIEGLPGATRYRRPI